MKLLKLYPLIIILAISSVLGAQDFAIGIRYGYGEGSYKRINTGDIVTKSRMNQFGLSLSYSPFNSKLSVESALAIEKGTIAEYFYVPISFRISTGKYFKPFFEGGAYYSFLTKSKTDIYSMKNDYGARIGAGIQFVIRREWRIEGGLFQRFGFAKSLEEQIIVPGNTYIEEKSHISPFNFEITLKYRY